MCGDLEEIQDKNDELEITVETVAETEDHQGLAP
jgi:hypothetical protein